MDLITEILKRARNGVHRSTLLTELDRHASQHDIKAAIAEALAQGMYTVPEYRTEASGVYYRYDGGKK